MECLKVMEAVLRQEAESINALADSLDEKYVRLIEMCKACEGKLIFTGMGKSGHVAKKISATMSSLGTPSLYLHPGEAAHGDLGMVEARDLVIMISKSGETGELAQLINSFKIIGCRLVGIFCKKDSLLEQYCDLTIVIPIEREACVNNLAPTTSTTVTMALGDALAVQLSELKNFTRTDFALYHPQGTLGKQLLMTVDMFPLEEMDEIAVPGSESIRQALWKITKNRLGAAAVVDPDFNLIGLISDGDIRRGLEKKDNVLEMNVKELMTASPVNVHNNVLVADALRIMQGKKISVLPITDAKGKLINMISFHDVVKTGITG